MSVLVISEQGAEVSRATGRLRITRGGTLLREVRLLEVEQLVLLGSVALTPAVVRWLLRERIDTVFLTMGGMFLGRLSGGLGKNVLLRAAQHRVLVQPPRALELARACVRAKVANQRRLLQRAQRRRPHADLARALVQLRVGLERLEHADELDVLRGHEGRAAAAYFAAFGRTLEAPGITFERRLRRPPPDPVNILLSFGYTMLLQRIVGMCERAGLDPYLGALHTMEYGRPSLALDLLEEFRPLLVDATVVTTLNRRELGVGDFVFSEEDEAPVEDAWEREEGAAPEAAGAAAEAGPFGTRRVVFRREGVLEWVTALERRLDEKAFYEPLGGATSYRQVMQEQVYRAARWLEGGEPYEGFEGPT